MKASEIPTQEQISAILSLVSADVIVHELAPNKWGLMNRVGSRWGWMVAKNALVNEFGWEWFVWDQIRSGCMELQILTKAERNMRILPKESQVIFNPL